MNYQDFKQMEQLISNQQKVLEFMEQLIEFDKAREGELFKAGTVKAYISMNKNACEALISTINKYMPQLEQDHKKEMEKIKKESSKQHIIKPTEIKIDQEENSQMLLF